MTRIWGEEAADTHGQTAFTQFHSRQPVKTPQDKVLGDGLRWLQRKGKLLSRYLGVRGIHLVTLDIVLGQSYGLATQIIIPL